MPSNPNNVDIRKGRPEVLQILVQPNELWDESKQEFINLKAQVLQLEHSLVSLSKWESIYCKPFLSKGDKTMEESREYVKCMTITQNVDPSLYMYLNDATFDEVRRYIEAPMTATTFSKDREQVTNREIITAEIIYYWMIALNIPFECQKWHLNRLLTLINVCSIKNQPPKKMKQKDLLSRNRQLNELRRQQFNTNG